MQSIECRVVNRIDDLRAIITGVKRGGRVVGLVPTMGALHEGHLSLVKASKDNGDFTVVSIFVNPSQFGPNEDFNTYPRPFEADAAKCEAAGVDLIFAPTPEEIYPDGFDTFVEVGGITEKLEGVRRPGHFRGVTTVVTKLFAAVEPRRAYFGMKDYQQLKVIQKMVRDLNIRIDVIPVPTLRESNGLAKSSRNAYLSETERKAAAVLHQSLITAKSAVESGETSGESLRRIVEKVIESEPLTVIDYVAVVDPETLDPVDKIENGALVALAIRIGNTRLIDNMVV